MHCMTARGADSFQRFIGRAATCNDDFGPRFRETQRTPLSYSARASGDDRNLPLQWQLHAFDSLCLKGYDVQYSTIVLQISNALIDICVCMLPPEAYIGAAQRRCR
jgi:hypothetical protein